MKKHKKKSSGVCCHPSGRALRRLLPHTFSAVSRSGVHPHRHSSVSSPTAATSVPSKLNDTTTDFNECLYSFLVAYVVRALSFDFFVRLLLLADGKDGSLMGGYGVEERI